MAILSEVPPLSMVDVADGRTTRTADGFERIGWMLAALTVALFGFRLWAGASLYPWLSIAAPLLVLSGLAGVVCAWTLEGRRARVFRLALAPLWLAGFAGYCLLVTTGMPGYGTDALAFNQQAAADLLHGVNPYTASFAHVLDHFMVPQQYHTWLLNGRELERLSYPALSFLVYVPVLALGGGMQAAAIVNFAAWAASVLLLWRLLPDKLRWVAPVVGTFALYLDMAVGGVTDMVFLPPLIVALARWDRFADPRVRGVARWSGPAALGLAMCVKQTPWFVLPFLLVGLALEARGRGVPAWWRVPGRYLGAVAAVFLAVNAPFLAWAPGAFIHGMLVPFVEPTVPAGQGIITLALFEGAGGSLALFKLAACLAIPVALLAFATGYSRCKYALVPLAALVFFWATRSYESYMIDLLPAAVVAGATVRQPAAGAGLGRARRPALAALGVAAGLLAAAVAIALMSPQPLRLKVVAMRSTGQEQSVRQMTVSATNTSDRVARPVFSVLAGQYLTRSWRIVGGPPTLAPHQTADITLEAPNAQSMPALEGGWVVTAFQRRPASVSVSRPIPPSDERLTFSPSTVDTPVPVGRTIRLDVQLRDRLGSPRRRAGVTVELGQVVYTEQGALAGETEINGADIGQSPVATTTDGRGVAHFTIRGDTGQTAPVFFQAYVAPPGGVPHSYSDQWSVQFVGR
jgi:uncharacterized membrane protein